ncbi:MAG: flagella assembly protein FlgT middle domain-containing protein [Marinobacter sp.]|uniref:flagella assembly protein FlgT middle domain-containing protein n=1 Tax=Marinobacter sp. TaxID=50741 RepID=UPI00396EA4F6
MIALFFIIFLAVSMPVHGYNYLALGEATVLNDQIEAARILAAKRSLRDIVFGTGLSPSALKNILVYINEKSEIVIDGSSGTVPIKVNNIKELKRGNEIEVTAAVEVQESNHCPSSPGIVGAVSILPFEFDSRAIFVSEEFGRNLEGIFERYISILDRFGAGYKVKITNAEREVTKHTSDHITPKQSVRELAQELKSDYILGAEIYDTSIQRLGATPETYKKLVRNFSISFSVFDGRSGYKLSEYHYKTSASWPYKYTFYPDRNAHVIWDTEYGVAIEEVLYSAIQDLSFFIECERPKS